MPQLSKEDQKLILDAISPHISQTHLNELLKDQVALLDEGTSIDRRYAPKRYQVRSELHPTTGSDPHRYYQKLYPGHPEYAPDDPDYEQEITKEEFDKAAHEREAYKTIRADYDKRRKALEQKIKDVQERQAKTAPDINAPAKPKPRVFKSQKEYDEYLEAKYPGSKRPQPTTAKSVIAETTKKQIAQRKAKKELRQKSKDQKKAKKMKKDYLKVFKDSFVTAPDPSPITQTAAMDPLEDSTASIREKMESQLAERQKSRPGTEAEILASMTKEERRNLKKPTQAGEDPLTVIDKAKEKVEAITRKVMGDEEPATIEEKNNKILRKSIPLTQKWREAPTERQVRTYLKTEKWTQSAIDEFIEMHRDKLRK